MNTNAILNLIVLFILSLYILPRMANDFVYRYDRRDLGGCLFPASLLLIGLFGRAYSTMGCETMIWFAEHWATLANERGFNQVLHQFGLSAVSFILAIFGLAGWAYNVPPAPVHARNR